MILKALEDKKEIANELLSCEIALTAGSCNEYFKLLPFKLYSNKIMKNSSLVRS